MTELPLSGYLEQVATKSFLKLDVPLLTIDLIFGYTPTVLPLAIFFSEQP